MTYIKKFGPSSDYLLFQLRIDKLLFLPACLNVSAGSHWSFQVLYKLLILFLSEFAFADNKVKHFDCDSAVGCVNSLGTLDGLLELTDTEVLESSNTDCCLSDWDGTGIEE